MMMNEYVRWDAVMDDRNAYVKSITEPIIDPETVTRLFDIVYMQIGTPEALFINQAPDFSTNGNRTRWQLVTFHADGRIIFTEGDVKRYSFEQVRVKPERIAVERSETESLTTMEVRLAFNWNTYCLRATHQNCDVLQAILIDVLLA